MSRYGTVCVREEQNVEALDSAPKRPHAPLFILSDSVLIYVGLKRDLSVVTASSQPGDLTVPFTAEMEQIVFVQPL